MYSVNYDAKDSRTVYMFYKTIDDVLDMYSVLIFASKICEKELYKYTLKKLIFYIDTLNELFESGKVAK